MRLELSHEEHAYIVDNSETDLVLTEFGMKLIEIPRDEGDCVVIDGSWIDYEEFLNEVREEFIWKSQRLKNPRILINLARRLLPDFDAIEPLYFY